MRTVVELQKIDLNEGLAIDFTACESAEEGFALDFSAQDERTVFLFKGTGTVKFLQGNGIQGVVDTDALDVSEFGAFRLDSGAYKFVSGEDKGYAVAIPTGDIEAAVIQLP